MKHSILSRFFALLLVLFSVPYSCWSHEVVLCTEEEYSDLDQFFRAVITDDGCGWVMFGSKPVCSVPIPGLNSLPWHLIQKSPLFPLIKGFDTLNRLVKPGAGSSGCFCTWYGNSFDGVEIVFIHKKQLEATIEDNLSLFREKWGPLTSKEQIFSMICDSTPSQYMCDCLDKSPLLLGILFGYGTQNAQLINRDMALKKELEQCSSIPFVRAYTKITHMVFGEEELDTYCDSCFESRDCFRCYVLSDDSVAPQSSPRRNLTTFGFDSIASEADAIEKQINLFSLGFGGSRALTFGYIDSPESQRLIDVYTNDHKKIMNFLEQPDFCEKIFEAFFGRKLVVNKEKKEFSTSSNNRIHDLLARCVIVCKNDLDPRVQTDFLEGFFDKNLNQNSASDWCEAVLPALDEAKKNAQSTKEHFLKLSTTPDMLPLVERLLYCRTLEHGSGESLHQFPAKVVLSYHIRTVDSEILSLEQKLFLNTKDLISGMIHGMKGMKEGERRELHIHPSLGYGLFTPFYRCGTLIADVTLNKIVEQNSADWPSVEPLNLSWIEDPEKEEQIRKEIHDDSCYLGVLYRKKVEMIPGVNLDILCDSVKKMLSDQESTTLSSLELMELCRSL